MPQAGRGTMGPGRLSCTLGWSPHAGLGAVPWLDCSPGVTVGENWGSPTTLGLRARPLWHSEQKSGVPAPPCVLPPGLEPEIQKLIAKHKQEVKRLRGLHAAELQQAEEQAAQRYGRQAEALREQLQREKEALGQQERERAQQRSVSLLGGLARGGVGKA